MYIDKTDQRPYQPYKNDESSIWILMDDGKILELADASKIVFAVMNTNEDQKKVYFPKELNE
jgi:HD superfamily phosphohydrolase